MGPGNLLIVPSDHAVTLGRVGVFLCDQITGETTEAWFDNTVTQALLNRLASWLAGANNTGYNPVSPPTKFQLGTGTGTPGLSDQSLFTPVANTLIAVSTRNASSNTATITISYSSGLLNTTYTECGLLGADNVLLTHLKFTNPVTVSSTQSALFQYELTTGAG